jgi:hypothetical protein
LKATLDLLRAEVASYRKRFKELETLHSRMASGVYGRVEYRAIEAFREELDQIRNIALRYDVLLGRVKKKKPENPSARN